MANGPPAVGVHGMVAVDVVPPKTPVSAAVDSAFALEPVCSVTVPVGASVPIGATTPARMLLLAPCWSALCASSTV